MCAIGYTIVTSSEMVKTMKGYTFYRDCGSASNKNILRRDSKMVSGVVPSKLTQLGNVIAVFTDQEGYWSGSVYCVSTMAALTRDANSPVCSCSASVEYIRTACIRVSETVARQIHPEMFRVLDS
jgi:hypothetical protein